MEFPFTKEEVRILKKICENPIFKESQPLPLHDQKTLKPIHKLTFIKRIVSSFYDITSEELVSDRRDKHFIQARRDYCHLAFQQTKFSTKIIGNEIKRNSSSVLYHLNKQPVNLEKIIKRNMDTFIDE